MIFELLSSRILVTLFRSSISLLMKAFSLSENQPGGCAELALYGGYYYRVYSYAGGYGCHWQRRVVYVNHTRVIRRVRVC